MLLSSLEDYFLINAVLSNCFSYIQYIISMLYFHSAFHTIYKISMIELHEVIFPHGYFYSIVDETLCVFEQNSI